MTGLSNQRIIKKTVVIISNSTMLKRLVREQLLICCPHLVPFEFNELADYLGSRSSLEVELFIFQFPLAGFSKDIWTNEFNQVPIIAFGDASKVQVQLSGLGITPMAIFDEQKFNLSTFPDVVRQGIWRRVTYYQEVLTTNKLQITEMNRVYKTLLALLPGEISLLLEYQGWLRSHFPQIINQEVTAEDIVQNANAIISQDPGSLEVWFDLALVYEKTFEYERAKEIYRHIEAMKPREKVSVLQKQINLAQLSENSKEQKKYLLELIDEYYLQQEWTKLVALMEENFLLIRPDLRLYAVLVKAYLNLGDIIKVHGCIYHAIKQGISVGNLAEVMHKMQSLCADPEMLMDALSSNSIEDDSREMIIYMVSMFFFRRGELAAGLKLLAKLGNISWQQNARNLYDLAYDYYKKGQSVVSEGIYKLLLENVPDSEVRWW